MLVDGSASLHCQLSAVQSWAYWPPGCRTFCNQILVMLSVVIKNLHYNSLDCARLVWKLCVDCCYHMTVIICRKHAHVFALNAAPCSSRPIHWSPLLACFYFRRITAWLILTSTTQLWVQFISSSSSFL